MKAADTGSEKSSEELADTEDTSDPPATCSVRQNSIRRASQRFHNCDWILPAAILTVWLTVMVFILVFAWFISNSTASDDGSSFNRVLLPILLITASVSAIRILLAWIVERLPPRAQVFTEHLDLLALGIVSLLIWWGLGSLNLDLLECISDNCKVDLPRSIDRKLRLITHHPEYVGVFGVVCLSLYSLFTSYRFYRHRQAHRENAAVISTTPDGG